MWCGVWNERFFDFARGEACDGEVGEVIEWEGVEVWCLGEYVGEERDYVSRGDGSFSNIRYLVM